MKKSFFASHRGAFALFALLAVCAALAFSRLDLRATHYFVKEHPFRVEAASRRDEALVLVASGAQGWRGSKLEEWGTGVGEAFGVVTDTPEPLRGTLSLFRLRPAAGPDAARPRSASGAGSNVAGLEVERRELSGLPPWGILFAEGGELYYVSGYEEEEEFEDDGPRDAATAAKAWRWDGADFAAVGDDVAAQLLERAGRQQRRAPASEAQTPSTDARGTEAVRPGGWTLAEGFLGRGSAEVCSFEAAGERWGLLADGFRPAGDGAGALSLMSGRRWRGTLARFSGDWAETDAARFEAMRYEGFGKLAGSYFGRQMAPNATTMIFWLALSAALPYFWMRNALSRSVSRAHSYPDARPEHFPFLDRDKLDLYTAALEARGFVRLRDFTIVSSNNTSPARPLVFGRLFAHPELHLFAELGQLFGTKHPSGELGCAVFSHFEQGWALSVTSRRPNSVTYLVRRPRRLWLSRPGATVEELLDWHLDLRGQMVTVLDLKVSEDVRAETFFRSSSEAVEEMRQIIKRRSRWLLPLLFEYWRLEAHTPHEWLGDYGLRAPDGWAAPAAAAGAGAAGGVRASAAVWARALGLVANVMLLMSCVLFFFNTTHSRGALYFRLGLCASGLALSFLPNILGVRKR